MDSATSVLEIYDSFAFMTKFLMTRSAAWAKRSGDVTLPQARALRALANGPLSMGSLSQRLYVQPSTVSGMVDRLEAKDLVERCRTAADKRRVDVALTSAGREFVAAAPVSVVQLALDRLHELPPDELKNLHGAVMQLRGVLDGAVASVMAGEPAEVRS